MKKIIIVFCIFLSSSVYTCDCDRVFLGRYILGHEVESFQPCGSKKVYWVSSSTWTKEPLLEFMKKITIPYKPVYIKFRGHLLNEETDGFASDYDGLIRFSKIDSISETIPIECDKLDKN